MIPITIFLFWVWRYIMIPTSIMITIELIILMLPILFPIAKPTIIADFPTFKQTLELRRFKSYFWISLKILAHSVISQSLEFLIFLIAAICVFFVASTHLF